MNSLGNSLARWWWVAGAAVLAAFFLYVGIDNLVGEYAPLPEAAVQCFTGVAFLVTGIVLRVKAPRTAAALIAAPALPTSMIWWAWPIAVLAALVAVGAVVEVVRRSRPGVLPRIGAVVGTLLLGAGFVVPALGWGPGRMGDLIPFFILGVGVVGGGIALLVLTRARTTHPAQAAPLPTRVA